MDKVNYHPHIVSILLSIILPLLLLIIAVLTFNTVFYLLSLLYYYTPLLVMLILYIFSRRTLSSIDIELYGGLSSRFMILSSFFLRGLLSYNLFGFLIFELPLYGFIAPIEDYILLSSYGLLYRYGEIFNIMSIVFTLFIIALYLYLIFWGRRYQVKALKIYYLIVIILGFIVVFGGMRSRFGYIMALQAPFLMATVARLVNLTEKKSDH